MASSSVSQDDFDNDFEKNSRRSRIRTARARQINPCGIQSSQGNNHPNSHQQQILEEANYEDSTRHLDHSGTLGASVADADHCVKDINSTSTGSSMSKRGSKMGHHINKGKQQRDRRKLREKRRSTGVVHLASTESTTGGSTTGSEDENSDILINNASSSTTSSSITTSTTVATSVVSSSPSLSETTKRNTQMNENYHHHHSHHHHHVATTQSSHHSRSTMNSTMANNSAIRNVTNSLRKACHKSTSDLEADDENDQDSKNQSEESSSTFSSTNHIPCVTPPPSQANEVINNSGSFNTNTPVQRPATPTEIFPEQIERVVEENKRLLSLMEEKDKKIHLLEFQIQQLLKDSKNEEKF